MVNKVGIKGTERRSKCFQQSIQQETHQSYGHLLGAVVYPPRGKHSSNKCIFLVDM